LFSGFPSPAEMSLTKLSLAGNNFPVPVQGRFVQNKSRNLVIFFTVYVLQVAALKLVCIYFERFTKMDVKLKVAVVRKLILHGKHSDIQYSTYRHTENSQISANFRDLRMLKLKIVSIFMQ